LLAARSKLVLLIEQCKGTSSIDDQITLLFQINALLPKSQQLQIPSLITRDYVSKAIGTVQDWLNPVIA
jgi:hypothetical protein